MDIENIANIEVEPSVDTSGEINVETEKVGPAGASAYQIAVKNGYLGTEEQWLASLKGDTGATGQNGVDGIDGKSLEFNWNNTNLGIRQEGQSEYQYQDLKGNVGPAGRDGAIQYTAGNNITIENNVISATGGGSDLPIYIFETTIDAHHNTKNINNTTEKARLSEIINAIYNLETKNGLILLHSSTSNMQFLFLQKGALTTSSSQVDFYTNTVARDMNDSNRIIANIHLSVYGTWSNNVFTCSSAQFWPEDAYSLSSFMTMSGNQSVSGKKTFTTLPESSVTPSSNDQLVNKSYVDSAISTAITDALGGSY